MYKKLTFKTEDNNIILLKSNPIIKLDFRNKLESIYLDVNKNKIVLADESKYLIYIYDFTSLKLLDMIGKEFLTNEPKAFENIQSIICAHNPN